MAEATDPRDRRVVLGLGNVLNRDEGLGVHALHALAERLGPDPGVELVDGGVLGLNLLPIVESSSHLLVLDAVDAGRPPGTVVELDREEIPLLQGIRLSEHQVTFQEVLGLASIRGRLPRVLHLLGAQPGDLAVGVEVGPAVADAIPQIVERAVALLDRWGATAPASAGDGT